MCIAAAVAGVFQGCTRKPGRVVGPFDLMDKEKFDHIASRANKAAGKMDAVEMQDRQMLLRVRPPAKS
jgi:hypothetical protein